MRPGKGILKLLILALASLGLFGLHTEFVRILQTHVMNVGVSFGISLPGQMIILSAILLLASFYWALRSNSWAMGIIIAGGWVNLLDRWLYGYVHDYWKLPFVDLYNNIADWVIFVGIIVFVREIYKEIHDKRVI